jgi:hypothetical protein
MWKKYRLIALWGLAVGLAVFNFYDDLIRENPRKYDPEFWFPEETRIPELAEISRDAPPIFLPDILQENWDYVCFVGPLQLSNDPGLEGVDLPYHSGEPQMLFVVLRRGSEHETHLFYRDELWVFHLFGLEDLAACYDDTAVTIEYVERPWITISPRTLHVKPVGWSGDPPGTLR